jgi:hypothetical protein
VGVSPNDKVGMLHGKYLHARAKQILDQPRIWQQVEAVAKALMVKKTLPEKEVKQICRDAISKARQKEAPS